MFRMIEAAQAVLDELCKKQEALEKAEDRRTALGSRVREWMPEVWVTSTLL